MTNYNERLDEIIQVLAMEEQGVADDFAVEAIDEGTYQVRDDVARNQAKWRHCSFWCTTVHGCFGRKQYKKLQTPLDMDEKPWNWFSSSEI